MVQKNFTVQNSISKSYLCVCFHTAQAVNSRCSEDDQCGGGAQCKGGRCLCGPGKSPKKVTDIYGRFMDRCLNISGEFIFLAEDIIQQKLNIILNSGRLKMILYRFVYILKLENRIIFVLGGSRMEYYFLLHSIGILLSIRQIF